MTNELTEGNICLGSASSVFWGVLAMRSKWMLCVGLGLAAAAFAKDPQPYQTGKLLQMDSVQCGAADNKQTQELLCQEYVLQADRVIYRIRPRA